MIYAIENPLLLPKILELARQVPDAPIEKLENMLIQGISRRDAKIYVDERGDRLAGFIFATIELVEGEKACFIQFCSVDPFVVEETPQEHSVFDNLLGRIITWAKELELPYLYMGTKRHKAFKRRAQFEYCSTIMRRKLS